jgi:membrane protein
MTIKAILFDIDGTLVDSNEQHISAWIDAFAGAGYHFDRAIIHEHIGKGGDMLVPSLIPDASGDEVTQLGTAQGTAFRERYREEVKPLPGARDLLERVAREGLTVTLASSASAEEIDYWTDLIGIGDLVTAATSRDDVVHSKPAPDIFRAALDKVAPVQPWEAVVIGDTPYDLIAAAKNTIPSIAVRSGRFSDETLRSHRPIAIYDDVAALLAEFDDSPLARTAELTAP